MKNLRNKFFEKSERENNFHETKSWEVFCKRGKNVIYLFEPNTIYLQQNYFRRQ